MNGDYEDADADADDDDVDDGNGDARCMARYSDKVRSSCPHVRMVANDDSFMAISV